MERPQGGGGALSAKQLTAGQCQGAPVSCLLAAAALSVRCLIAAPASSRP